jgi:hypothetical protein
VPEPLPRLAERLTANFHNSRQNRLRLKLVIHRIYNGYWFWGRPQFGDLRRDLRGVHPDWVLSTPGLREARDAGDRSKHCP